MSHDSRSSHSSAFCQPARQVSGSRAYIRRTVSLMKSKGAVVVVVVSLLMVVSIGCNNFYLYRHQSAECKERGKAYSARAEKLKRDAADVLRVGTKRDVVIRFFQNNGIPPTVFANEITGTINLKGCAPTGCGSDDALLGSRVEVDKEGTATSKPAIGALYTGCL